MKKRYLFLPLLMLSTFTVASCGSNNEEEIIENQISEDSYFTKLELSMVKRLSIKGATFDFDIMDTSYHFEIIDGAFKTGLNGTVMSSRYVAKIKNKDEESIYTGNFVYKNGVFSIMDVKEKDKALLNSDSKFKDDSLLALIKANIVKITHNILGDRLEKYGLNRNDFHLSDYEIDDLINEIYKEYFSINLTTIDIKLRSLIKSLKKETIDNIDIYTIDYEKLENSLFKSIKDIVSLSVDSIIKDLTKNMYSIDSIMAILSEFKDKNVSDFIEFLEISTGYDLNQILKKCIEYFDSIKGKLPKSIQENPSSWINQMDIKSYLSLLLSLDETLDFKEALQSKYGSIAISEFINLMYDEFIHEEDTSLKTQLEKLKNHLKEVNLFTLAYDSILKNESDEVKEILSKFAENGTLAKEKIESILLDIEDKIEDNISLTLKVKKDGEPISLSLSIKDHINIPIDFDESVSFDTSIISNPEKSYSLTLEDYRNLLLDTYSNVSNLKDNKNEYTFDTISTLKDSLDNSINRYESHHLEILDATTWIMDSEVILVLYGIDRKEYTYSDTSSYKDTLLSNEIEIVSIYVPMVLNNGIYIKK